MTQPHHRNRHPKYRNKYKIHNWQSYERSLINRGDLTLWLSEDVIKAGQINIHLRANTVVSASDEAALR